MNRALIDRALKIKALAQRGEGGEKRNAEQLLASFLERNGLTLDDLSTEQVSEQPFFFRCPNKDLMLLNMNQCNHAHLFNTW